MPFNVTTLFDLIDLFKRPISQYKNTGNPKYLFVDIILGWKSYYVFKEHIGFPAFLYMIASTFFRRFPISGLTLEQVSYLFFLSSGVD